jgi:hypothetical protein
MSDGLDVFFNLLTFVWLFDHVLRAGCSRMDLRQRVVPDASQLCAVSLHAGASSRTVSAQYDWDYLAAAPCILISMGNAYCY